MPKVAKIMIWISSVGRTLNDSVRAGRWASGFTLIEMVATLVLLMLFMGLTAPHLMTTLDRIESDSSVRKMVSMLAATRSQAIAEKTTLIFRGDIDQNQYWVSDPRAGENSSRVQLEPMIQLREFNDGETSFRAGIFSITFYPMGNTSGGTILLEPSDSHADAPSFLLTIDPVTGKPYLQHAF